MTEQQSWQEVDRERQAALGVFKEAFQQLEKARKEYDRALLEAHRIGVTNASLSRITVQTEAAIRQSIRRKKGLA